MRIMLSLTILACLAGLPSPRPAAADVIIVAPNPLIRKFPSFVFCPFPSQLELVFVATGATATVHVVANTHVFGIPFEGPPARFMYAHQGIDNISVVPLAVYEAHVLVNDENNQFGDCYSPNARVPLIFKFEEIVPPTSVPMLETFDSAPSGWDMSQGAYYDSRSAYSRATPPFNTVPGSLGLGADSGSPSLADSARTSVTVGGLTEGQTYVLSGWWIVDEGIQTDDVSLTIQITGPDNTPITRRTWGAVKDRYRQSHGSPAKVNGDQ